MVVDPDSGQNFFFLPVGSQSLGAYLFIQFDETLETLYSSSHTEYTKVEHINYSKLSILTVSFYKHGSSQQKSPCNNLDSMLVEKVYIGAKVAM